MTCPNALFNNLTNLSHYRFGWFAERSEEAGRESKFRNPRSGRELRKGWKRIWMDLEKD